MSDPLISVIMSVYNCESTVAAAVESIMKQTYANWEFIICDDASTDHTGGVLHEIAQSNPTAQIVLLRNEVNRKLAYSLNRCLERASGELIARMDGDDISESDRFARQVKFLAENPGVDLVGTSMRRFNAEGLADVIHPAAVAPDKMTLARTSKSPFFHATIMARRRAFDLTGGYTVLWRTARTEDVDLWYKFFAAGLVGHNLRTPLYRVREDAAAIRRRTPSTRVGGFLTRIRGNWALRYPPAAYIKDTLNLLKIFVPYRIFDWHRERSRRRAIAESTTRLTE